MTTLVAGKSGMYTFIRVKSATVSLMSAPQYKRRHLQPDAGNAHVRTC